MTIPCTSCANRISCDYESGHRVIREESAYGEYLHRIIPCSFTVHSLCRNRRNGFEERIRARITENPDTKSRLHDTWYRDHAETHALRNDKDPPSFFPRIQRRRNSKMVQGTRNISWMPCHVFVSSRWLKSYLKFLKGQGGKYASSPWPGTVLLLHFIARSEGIRSEKALVHRVGNQMPDRVKKILQGQGRDDEAEKVKVFSSC